MIGPLPRARPVATALALAGATLLLYAFHVGRAPIYLAHDEVIFALNARAIALTGHDVTGRHWPLYIGHFWATPLNIYFTALFLRFVPLSETIVRLPTVLVGTIDVALMYLIARRFFARETMAVAAAVLLALTPVHVIHSRLGVDHLYPLPFVMLWLLGLVAFLERERPWVLFGAALSLGIGFYSYLAAEVMMPVYFAVTGLVLATRRASPRMYLVASAGFLLPLVPLVPWHLHHPTQFAQQLAAYGLYDPGRGSPLGGVRSLLSLPSVSTRAGVYYNFFNPALLFLTGDTSVVNSTREAGVFLWSIAVFLPAGSYAILTRHRTPATLTLLLCFALAPLAAVAVGEVMINRALLMVPFAILIATFGLEYLLMASRSTRRAAILGLVVLVPLQFAGFYIDYLTAYRVRSSRWFERNIRGAAEAIIARDGQTPAPAVYLSSEIVWIDDYWRFYLIKSGREDLLRRTVRFDPRNDDLQAMPWQSVALANFEPSRDEPLIAAGRLFRIAVIGEPDNAPSFSILGRN